MIIWGNEKWSWIITWSELFLFAWRKGLFDVFWLFGDVVYIMTTNDDEIDKPYISTVDLWKCLFYRWKNLRRKQSWTQIQSVCSSLIWHGYGEQTEHNAIVYLRLKVCEHETSYSWKHRGLRDIPYSSIFSMHSWPLQHTEDQFDSRQRLKMMTYCKPKGYTPKPITFNRLHKNLVWPVRLFLSECCTLVIQYIVTVISYIYIIYTDIYRYLQYRYIHRYGICT